VEKRPRGTRKSPGKPKLQVFFSSFQRDTVGNDAQTCLQFQKVSGFPDILRTFVAFAYEFGVGGSYLFLKWDLRFGQSEREGEIVMSRIALVAGVVVEELGADLMVMVPGSTEVLTLSGDAAAAVRCVQSGSPVATDAVVSDLVRLGVLETSGLSRRGLIKAGAIGAGAGIAVMSMPTVAMAASSCRDGGIGTFGEGFEWIAPAGATTSDFYGDLLLSTGESMPSLEAYQIDGGGVTFVWGGEFPVGELSVTGEFDYKGNCYRVTFELGT
jgi:hypothetical protein